MTLPEWTASVFPDQMIPLVEQGFALHTHNELMKLIKGGPLVTKIIYQMLEFKNGNSSRTVNLYSGHDLTLLSVIRLLNLTSETSRLPNYGATLAFELHCDNDLDCSRMEVRVSLIFGHLNVSILIFLFSALDRLYTILVLMTRSRRS